MLAMMAGWTDEALKQSMTHMLASELLLNELHQNNNSKLEKDSPCIYKQTKHNDS